MRSLERVNIRTNERTYVLTYICTGQTLYPLHNFVVRGDKNIYDKSRDRFHFFKIKFYLKSHGYLQRGYSTEGLQYVSL